MRYGATPRTASEVFRMFAGFPKHTNKPLVAALTIACAVAFVVLMTVILY